MIEQPIIPRGGLNRAFLFLTVILLIVVVFACSIYANLSFTVTNRANLQYFPPYKPGVDENHNHHLGAEYINIARAIRAGKGFANPFNNLDSGPTAWMPPVLPYLLAGLLWFFDGDSDSVMAVVIFLQVYALILTGLLVLALARQTTRVWPVAVVFVLVGMISDFRLWFQFTHDCWLILLVLDLLVAGFCWLRPLESRRSAVGWGLFGGCCALVNPILAFTWGMGTFLIGFHDRCWSRLGVTVLIAGLLLTPWTVRNYLVFGRLIPVKPNLSYELYQSQCLTPDGLIQGNTWAHHPNNSSAFRERQEYKSLGESAYLDRKREQFWQSVRKDPQSFLDRMGDRFLGATLWYQSMDRRDNIRRPWAFWSSRAIHPLPFLALLGLLLTAFWKRLPWAQWAVMGVYVLYLSPYIVVSYYERYAVPLLGVKVLLVVWAVDSLLALATRRNAPPGGVESRTRRSSTTYRAADAVAVPDIPTLSGSES